jgi:flagellar biosynthesis protein FliQ
MAFFEIYWPVFLVALIIGIIVAGFSSRQRIRRE